MGANAVTLFTGQWLDLGLEEVARFAGEAGYDGLELACGGDHLDVALAAVDDHYVADRLAILERHGLVLRAIAAHVVGQAVCDDPIDERHRRILHPRIWGDGDPEGVRRRAADEMATVARAARRLGADTVVGFSGSSIWRYVAMFPPVDDDDIVDGYADFAARWHPVLDAFDAEGVRFALEVHPGGIAFDHRTAAAALDAIGHRPAFGFNWDPSHMIWQGVDPATFIVDFADRIYHVDCKDTRVRPADGRRGLLGSHLGWGDPGRRWDFVSVGRGDVRWEDVFRALRSIGYDGPISIEWEDAGMDRRHGAVEALAHVRSFLFPPAHERFDAVERRRST